MKKVLKSKNDKLMLEKGTRLLEDLANLALERNLATHTMWASLPIQTMWTIGTPKMKLGRIRPCRSPKTSKRTSSINLQV